MGQLGQRSVDVVVRRWSLFRLLKLGLDQVGRRHMAVEKLADLRLGQGADKTVDRLAVLEHHAEGDRPHTKGLAELGCDLGLVVAVEFGKLEPARVGLFKLLKQWSQATAGAAPGRPDVQQHRLLLGCLDQLGFDILDRDVAHDVSSRLM